MSKEKYLVTPALPYANGPIHLGHMLEHIQVNVFARALKMAGKDVLTVCGADSHGTPIEMNAQKVGVSPRDFAQSWQDKQAQSFANFHISYDGAYGSTHSAENESHAQKIFEKLRNKGFIYQKEIEQLFDTKLNRFLPDRMVIGECPHCHAKDQYGDSCEACGRTYQPSDLISPKSALSGAVPVLKKSRHYFVTLAKFEGALGEWLSQEKAVHSDVRSSLEHWFKEGLKDWDISRDGPYFGFKIPGEDNKYFYVWLDAPIGYISLSEIAAKKINRSFADYWLDKNTKIIHFIGKDIVYFHTLFWPAMLMAADYCLPSQIIVHGMLTVNGEKMSKSRGTFILADSFAKFIDPEALRYYFACKLSRRSEDIDLNLQDFMQRVNTDLVNKIVNLLSRSLPLLTRYYEGKASVLDENAANLVKEAPLLVERVREFYLDNEPSKAVHEIVRFAEEGNKYLQDMAPWQLIKSDKAQAHTVLSTGLYVGKVCFALLKPVLPMAVEKLEKIINNNKAYDFNNISDLFDTETTFHEYEHLFKRVEESAIKSLSEESVQEKAKEKIEPENLVSIDQFMAVELRAAKVLLASSVVGSDKLIECKLDLGPLGERTVFTGLRPHVEPPELTNKTVVVVYNLAPRKMRFGTSEGMILACGEEKPQPLFLTGVNPGDRVR
jgi:methionyl-tRNA synthetase